MRFFANKYSAFTPGTLVSIEKERWVPQVCQIAESIVEAMSATLDNCDGGLYEGNAGIAYMFYRLATNAAFSDMRSDFLERAVMYAKVSEQYVKQTSQKDRASFLLGQAGVHAVSALIHEATSHTDVSEKFLYKYAAIADVCKQIDFLTCGSDEFFVGRAGYLCGALNLNQKLGKQVTITFKGVYCVLWNTYIYFKQVNDIGIDYFKNTN